MKKFSSAHRGTFSYWFAHWRAFNALAMKMHCWQWHHLFHDIEKPFLMLIWRDYARVQKWHREHNAHHIEYARGCEHWNTLDMILDWQCSHETKLDAQKRAIDIINDYLQKYDEYSREHEIFVKMKIVAQIMFF